MKKRQTIGFQITNLVEEYPKPIWRGIVDRAEELDVNVVIYRGESFNTPYGFGYQCNAILDLINPHYLDALILATGTICNFISKEQFNAYIQKLHPIPLVSISIAIPGIPSILVDNQSGIKEGVRHLVLQHKRKKIAFIKGPENNEEAVERYNAYIREMKALNIPIDPKLVVTGNFIEESGREAIVELIERRKAVFDALFASNDNMAIGAMNELIRRGLEVPEDVAVLGFDNIQDCENTIPSLSTIKQPLYYQGRTALQTAVDLIEGKNIPEKTVLPTILLPRSSCGCLGYNVEMSGVGKTINNFELKTTAELKNEINHILESADYMSPKAAAIDEYIQNILTVEAKGNKKQLPEPGYPVNTILRKLTKSLSSQMKEGINIELWKEILGVLHQYIAGQKDPNWKKTLEIIKKSYELVQELLHSFNISQRIKLERQELIIRIVIQEIISSLSIDGLLNNIINNIGLMDLKNCYIFTYGRVYKQTRDMEWLMPEKVKLILAFDAIKGLKIVNPEGFIQPNKDFIPENLIDQNRRHSFLVLPMYFLEYQYGYMIFDLEIKNGNIYDFLSLEISSTYRSVLLLEERQKAEEKLRRVLSELEETNQELASLSETDELTGLYNRRGFLKFGIKNLTLARQMREDGALFFIDLDGLKKINDTYGHETGDEALRASSDILKKTFRKMDTIARLGGDEFVALIMNINEDTVNNLQKRLRQELKEYNKNSGNPFKLSLSIGKSLYSWQDASSTLPDLISRADAELYQEKKKKNSREI